MIRIAVLLAALGCGLASAAPAGAEDQPIPLEEWRRMTEGRTVYYYVDGQFFGREYYWPGTDMVTFQHASGQCADARWDYADGIYCFHFDRPHCFAHVRRGERIFVIPRAVPLGGDETEQEVRRIVAAPFSCAPGLSS
ncbi:MAG: hypothetical protein KatS3mg118_1529 [Paracoccaceae bacterium]|nr:MAG: hypothetical protein KatS3mg118_1529 [Paracoccaceae bacterium]